MSDKEIERHRYDQRATNAILGNAFLSTGGVFAIRGIYRAPYFRYVELIKRHLACGSVALEVGAGSGLFTGDLLKTGAQVLATDISKKSLEILALNYANFDQLTTEVADMENLPYLDGSFDFIASSGSLSYGDNRIVMNEVFRLLKPGGIFLCVDSLDNNRIYRFNRWMNYLLGKRTLSTCKRMPNLQLIEAYRSLFESVDVEFFGSGSFLGPTIAMIFGENRAATYIDNIDKYFKTKASAFKFVMLAKK